MHKHSFISYEVLNNDTSWKAVGLSQENVIEVSIDGVERELSAATSIVTLLGSARTGSLLLGRSIYAQLLFYSTLIRNVQKSIKIFTGKRWGRR